MAVQALHAQIKEGTLRLLVVRFIEGRPIGVWDADQQHWTAGPDEQDFVVAVLAEYTSGAGGPMAVKVTIEVEVEFRQGKFKPKDEIAEAICEEVISGYGTFEVDDSSYEIIDAVPAADYGHWR